METIGWLSILPPIVAIALAIKTREVYISLALFVWLGWTLLNSWNPIVGLVQGVNVFLDAITSPGNARTLLFSALIGAIITLTQASAGWKGSSGGRKRRSWVGVGAPFACSASGPAWFSSSSPTSGFSWRVGVPASLRPSQDLT